MVALFAGEEAEVRPIAETRWLSCPCFAVRHTFTYPIYTSSLPHRHSNGSQTRRPSLPPSRPCTGASGKMTACTKIHMPIKSGSHLHAHLIPVAPPPYYSHPMAITATATPPSPARWPPG